MYFRFANGLVEKIAKGTDSPRPWQGALPGNCNISWAFEPGTPRRPPVSLRATVPGFFRGCILWMSSVEEGAVYSKIRQEKLSHSTPQSSPERFADSVMKLHPLLQVLAFLTLHLHYFGVVATNTVSYICNAQWLWARRTAFRYAVSSWADWYSAGPCFTLRRNELGSSFHNNQRPIGILQTKIQTIFMKYKRSSLSRLFLDSIKVSIKPK